VTEGLSCDEVREVAPDLALGLLMGEERADALAHLEQCEGCRAEVASLAVAADEVLLAAPAAAPPPGFADRVLARLAAERTSASARTGDGLPAVSSPGGRDRGPSRLVTAAVLAAAAVAVVVAGVVAVVRGGERSPSSEVAVAEMRTGTGRVVGDATAEGGASTVVTLDVPGWDDMVDRWGDAPAGSYWLVVEHDDGTRTMRALAPDVDDWFMRVDVPIEDIATVAMLDSEGRVWCTGRFDA